MFADPRVVRRVQPCGAMVRLVSVAAVAVLASCPGCALYFEDDDGGGGGSSGDEAGSSGPMEPRPTGSFTLVKTRAIAGELPVVGVDSDRAGGLWIAYRLQTGDYYSLADVRVVHVDAQGAKLSEFRYRDEYTQVSGIAYSGDAVWLSYNALGTGNNHVRKLDPVTGAQIGSFGTEAGIIDLDAHDDLLLLSNLWNEVIAIDRATGGEQWRMAVTAFEDSTQRGLAATADGRLWVASSATNRITLFDAQHAVIGSGTTTLLDAEWNGLDGLQLGWDGDELLLSTRNQISWLAPR